MSQYVDSVKFQMLLMDLLNNTTMHCTSPLRASLHQDIQPSNIGQFHHQQLLFHGRDHHEELQSNHNNYLLEAAQETPSHYPAIADVIFPSNTIATPNEFTTSSDGDIVGPFVEKFPPPGF